MAVQRALAGKTDETTKRAKKATIALEARRREREVSYLKHKKLTRGWATGAEVPHTRETPPTSSFSASADTCRGAFVIRNPRFQSESPITNNTTYYNMILSSILYYNMI